MKITRLGHAAVLLEGTKTVIIDPFLTDNPLASCTIDELPAIDLVLSTHDHFDHFNDVVAIAKKNNAPFVGMHGFTVREDVKSSGIETVGMNIGGTYDAAGIKVSLVPAVHSAETGSPSGVVVELDGVKVYHAGDTAVFSDMKLISELFGPLSVALLPIGGHFTMDKTSAAKAVEYLQPKITIPIHYNTWPYIEAKPEEFAKLCQQSTQVEVLEPGQSYEVST